VSGNVSLYNETKFPGEDSGRAILPTPTIGGVGLLADFTKSVSLAFKAEGDAILLIGETKGWLGQSLYLRDTCGREEGAPPPVDLAAEKRHGEFVRGLIAAEQVSAAHDVSDGGLAVALAEMAMTSGIGAMLEAPGSNIVPHGFWFGEDQARYVVTIRAAEVANVLKAATAAGIPIQRVGVTGGKSLILPGNNPILIADLVQLFEGWLPRYMAESPA
jgi:phosphoribosylformylglycinamidine synthase subunit PurL